MKRIACLLLLLGLLIGCGNPPEALPIVIVSETATTRTIEHTFGTTEIPKEPQRVIALGEEGLLADLLDIGIKPVLSTVNVVDDVKLISPEELDGIELLPSASNISPETLLSYSPDLIIAGVFFADQAGYGRLSEIAPTVTVGGLAMEQHVETLAIFGLREQGEANVAELQQRISSEAARIDASNIAVSVGAIYPGPNVAIFLEDRGGVPNFLSEMGVQLLPVEAERDDLTVRFGRAYISNERLDLLNGDQLILLQATSVDGEMEAVAEINADPLWQQLPAVKAGNVVTLDRLGYPGLRGQEALLEDLIAVLEE
ncbi:MAG: ABC transporter substrate-binding protein [Chloroflexota bacterium]